MTINFRSTVQAVTRTLFAGVSGVSMDFTTVTVLLVRMTAAQVGEWKWVGDEMNGTDPVEGWEVRSADGALLGAILPLGHRASRMHVEYYDPAEGDFFTAGQTGPVLTQGIAHVLGVRRTHALAA